MNGRPAEHRIALLQLLGGAGVLDNALWSLNSDNFNQQEVADKYNVNFTSNHIKVQKLPIEYENYNNITPVYSNADLYSLCAVFGDNHMVTPLMASQYIDTYFTVITETIHDYSHLYPAEKMWRPIVMGHPFIISATPGYYAKLKDMGFKTFDGIVDESFDRIENHVDRLHRCAEVIISLARLSHKELDSFMLACKDICEFNRQHIMSLYGQQVITNHNNIQNFLTKYIL